MTSYMVSFKKNLRLGNVMANNSPKLIQPVVAKDTYWEAPPRFPSPPDAPHSSISLFRMVLSFAQDQDPGEMDAKKSFLVASQTSDNRIIL